MLRYGDDDRQRRPRRVFERVWNLFDALGGHHNQACWPHVRPALYAVAIVQFDFARCGVGWCGGVAGHRWDRQKRRRRQQYMSKSESHFPVIYSIDGAPSEDGRFLKIKATAFDGKPIGFAIPVENIRHVVSFLLVWLDSMGSDHARAHDVGTSHADQCIPIPASSVGIGEPDNDQGYIGISVGGAELVFSVPLSAFAPLGQSLLLAGSNTRTAIRN